MNHVRKLSYKDRDVVNDVVNVGIVSYINKHTKILIFSYLNKNVKSVLPQVI